MFQVHKQKKGKERVRQRQRDRDGERERVCNVIQDQLGMANITSTSIRLMLPSISFKEMRSAYKAAKHFSIENALTSIKLPVNSNLNCVQLLESAKQFIFNCSIKVHEQ